MFRLASVSRRTLWVIVSLLCLLLTVQAVVLAATVKRNGGAVTAVRTAVNPGYDFTQSEIPVDVPGMSVSVKVPDGTRALLVVTFSATSMCGGPECKIRALVGNTAINPDAMTFIVEGGDEELIARQWVSPILGAGEYTVKLQYWVGESDSPGTFLLRDRTLTVLRSKV